MIDEELVKVWRMDDVPATITAHAISGAAGHFAKRIKLRNAREWIATVFVVLFFGWRAIAEASKLVSLGAASIAVGAVVVATVLWWRGRPSAPPPAGAATAVHLAHHRAELARQRDLLAGAWRWYVTPFVPGLVLWFAGFARRMPDHRLFIAAIAFGICAPILVGIAIVNRVAAKRIELAIAQWEMK